MEGYHLKCSSCKLALELISYPNWTIDQADGVIMKVFSQNLSYSQNVIFSRILL